MDIGAVASNSTIIDSEEDDRAFIEISELDRLLGLPPPRFDLGAADIIPLHNTVNSSHFDPEIEFAVPQKSLSPRRFDLAYKTDTEVSFNSKLANVSLIDTEFNLASDGQELECNSYLLDHVPTQPLPPTSNQDEMLYKRTSVRSVSKAGTLNRVVSRLLAKGDNVDDNILQSLLLEPQCLQPHFCDSPVPKIIPSPVINKLKKLGTSVQVESHTINGETFVPQNQDPIPTGYLQIMESLDKAVELTSDLSKKKKRKSPKKTSNNQVPSNLQLLAEVDNSDNLTKFSFQVDAKQVIELPEGQKLYTCDICSGVYHRGFSLKRHYLKTHVNYKHISKRDLHNCGILFDPTIERGGVRKKRLIKDDCPPVVTNLSPPNDIPDLYRCHTCFKCFMLISELKAHLMEHPPVSAQNLAEDQFRSYTCPNCKARYQKKKLFLCHKETCGVEVTPEVAQEVIASYFCLFCDKSFPSLVLRKKHQLQLHHPKKKLHQCYLCKTKMFKERFGVIKHLILHHPDEYIGCLSCKLRFGSREELKKHNKEIHKPSGTAKRLMPYHKVKEPLKVDSVDSSYKSETGEKPVGSTNQNLVWKCTECPKSFATHVNMTRHHRLAHRHPIRKKKILHKKETFLSEKSGESIKNPSPPPLSSTSAPQPSPQPLPDPEVLFYSTIAQNIKDNLTHHLDGKLDSQEIMEYDLKKTAETRSKVLNFSASFTPETKANLKPEATNTPLHLKESRSTPISPRSHWEKFNFPKNYDGRCGLTSYIKDMSHLDISTQLTMRRNLQRLNSTAGQESNKESLANIPAGLLLVEKPGPDCAETFGDPDLGKDKGGADSAELSGEWVRPRNFLCAACGYKSTSLWDVEDHKYALHPNVWVPHIEIVGEQSSPWDWFYHRRLPPETPVVGTTPAVSSVVPPCSKCSRNSVSMPELHRHMLDCGGDTSWQATMLAVASPGTRRRKWRPFGSRRRRQQGRRLLKRNIPNTPAKHLTGRIRTKPGDMDTIQKMIANLPAKRATRRVIGEEPDIKTRSQATISSGSVSSIHLNSSRFHGLKSPKYEKGRSKLYGQKKSSNNGTAGQEEKSKNKESFTIKEEPLEDVKEEFFEDDLQPLEAENTIQHSDILTSLQMIPVVKKPPVDVVKEQVETFEEPIETSKILAAMREAMMDSEDRVSIKNVDKPIEKKKKRKVKSEEKNIKSEAIHDDKKTEIIDGNLIICNGCGMQFDNSSACLRHKKKCVYWKEDKSSENIRNKCSSCGLVFPYLMALLRHDCLKVEVPDEPSMPELCPEKPVEEMQYSGTDDIPILSPAEVSRDDIYTRRMSIAEAVVKEVSVETFDVSDYHNQWFNSPIKTKTKHKPEKRQTNKADENPGEKLSNGRLIKLEEAVDSREEQVNSKIKEEKPTTSSITSLSQKNMVTSTKKPPNKVVSPQNRLEATKNIKVSDIFKEVKRRGRKRQKPKVVTYKPLNKVGLRRTSKMSGLVERKNKIVSRKIRSRSSNFVMLMKEWEKLEKEGAVAVGKRKRQCSNSKTNFGHVHRSRRSRTLSANTGMFDIESSTYDSFSPPDSEVEIFTKKTRRTKSVETISDGLPEKEKKELNKPVCSGKIKTEKEDTSLEIKISKKKNNINGNKKSHIVDEEISVSLIKEEKDEIVEKRKPGRPKFKNITIETAEHINETIDSIIMNTLEDQASKSSNDNFTSKTDTGNLLKPILLPKEEPEHEKSEAEDNNYKSKIDEDLKWVNVIDTIYNVSIGSAEIFSPSPSNLDTKEIGTRSRISINDSSEHTTVAESDSNGNNKSDFISNLKDENGKKSLFVDQKTEGSKSSNIRNRILEKTFDGVIENNKSSSASCASLDEKVPIEQPIRGKRKLSFSEEEKNGGTSVKRKEVKTKQLSIADYLSISQFVNRSSSSLNNQNIKNNSVETKSNEKLVKSNKTNKTLNDDPEVEVKMNASPKIVDKGNDSSLSEVPKVKDKVVKDSNVLGEKIKVRSNSELGLCMDDDKPSSPGSVSSREDVALSVIRDKVIQKRKKRLKMKKLMKKKQQLQLVDSKTTKMTKPKVQSEVLSVRKNKLKKFSTKIKVGVSRNRWEVSVVDNKKPVEVLCDDSKPPQNSNPLLEPVKKFYCATCDQKYESSYVLYQHQLTPEHKRNTLLAEQQRNVSDDNDPVKYCKSIGNIINDLEKRTLNVAKAMYQLKQSEPVSEAPAVAESSSAAIKETTDWSRCPTPSWETQQQTWDVDSFSTSSSLGSIMDTVNKLLSSEQETLPPYSWSDLQLAMGASDEEMAMLEQLGEHSLQEDYVYDSSRPVSEWLPPQEGSSILTDLDHQESVSLPPAAAAPPSTSDFKKLEPLSDSEDTKACRNSVGRPRRLLGEYETKEMVCPTCNRHFLGLLALQTHIGWSHCAPVLSSSRLVSGLKRRALDEMDRRLVCFVCKEIVPSASKLEAHIQAQHTKKSEEPDTKPVVSESAEKLRSKMSLALGGLVDRALNKMLGSNKALSEPSTSTSFVQADLNTGALQLLGRLCAARKRVGSDNIKSVTVGTRLSAELVQLVGRIRRESANPRPDVYRPAVDVKPTNLLDHLAVCSSDMQQRPYACPICDLRFLIPSTRNRHIARAHGKYGRRYDQDGGDCQGPEDFESGWKESLDANDDGEMLPLCSDCGLSFQSIHEVIQHRIEDHPRRYSADETADDSKPSVFIDKHFLAESSCEANQCQELSETVKSNDVKLLPVSDNAIDSTSTIKKKRGRPTKRKPSESEMKGTSNRKSNRKMGEKKTETVNVTNSEKDNKTNTDTPQEESKSPDAVSPEIDKCSDQNSTRNSSEENLAELSKKLDRRKVRMGNMAEEAVRVKAEAALRELNLSRKIKSSSSPAKWGIDSMKFTKQVCATSMLSSPVNGSPSKARFASLVEKKWKTPSAAPELDLKAPKPEPHDLNSDIYDFRDEDLDKKPFQQLKESHSPEVVSSESNKLIKCINSHISGNFKKISQNSKLSLDSS